MQGDILAVINRVISNKGALYFSLPGCLPAAIHRFSAVPGRTWPVAQRRQSLAAGTSCDEPENQQSIQKYT